MAVAVVEGVEGAVRGTPNEEVAKDAKGAVGVAAKVRMGSL